MLSFFYTMLVLHELTDDDTNCTGYSSSYHDSLHGWTTPVLVLFQRSVTKN